MSDPALSRPPFVPRDRFLCSLCFGIFAADQAWVDEEGQKWDVCKPCGKSDALNARVDVMEGIIRRFLDGWDVEQGLVRPFWYKEGELHSLLSYDECAILQELQ